MTVKHIIVILVFSLALYVFIENTILAIRGLSSGYVFAGALAIIVSLILFFTLAVLCKVEKSDDAQIDDDKMVCFVPVVRNLLFCILILMPLVYAWLRKIKYIIGCSPDDLLMVFGVSLVIGIVQLLLFTITLLLKGTRLVFGALGITLYLTCPCPFMAGLVSVLMVSPLVILSMFAF